jgi:hypothetical protein
LFVKTLLYLNVKIYIMATHGKFLYNLTVKGIRNGNDLELGVYGLFNTEKVHWTYYMISYYKNSKGDLYLTDDVCTCAYTQEANYDSIRKFGKTCITVEEGKQYLEMFKMKWDSGSNNTTSEMRDKKLDELLKP